jgi:hypothetical protein
MILHVLYYLRAEIDFMIKQRKIINCVGIFVTSTSVTMAVVCIPI